MSKSKRGRNSLRRSLPSREQKKSILIVVGGEKTEKNYFECLRKQYRATADINVVAEGYDPLTLTEKAITLADGRLREAKREGSGDV